MLSASLNKTFLSLSHFKVMIGSFKQQGRKEGNVLFNDTLNPFYLRLYGIIHMVKDHSDSERGNPLPPHGLLFPISSKGSFICIIPQTRRKWVKESRSDVKLHNHSSHRQDSTYHGLCYTSRALSNMII